MRFLIISLFVLSTGCVAKTKWDYQGGGKTLTNSKGEKLVRVNTSWGHINFQLMQIHSQMAPVKISVRNKTNSSIQLKESDFYIKDEESYNVSVLSHENVMQKLQAQATWGAGIVAGNGYGLNRAVSSKYVDKFSSDLFSFGEIRPNSARRGVIFFPAPNYKIKSLNIHFSKRLGADAESISFKNKQKARKKRSKR